MKRLTIATAIAATLGMGTMAQACPNHETHTTHRARTTSVRQPMPDRHYTADYGYTPGYYAPASGYGYYSNPGYGWDSGAYYNTYSTMGVGIGPFSIGF